MSEPFKDGPIEGVIVEPLKKHHDPRGWLVEVFRSDELAPPLFPVMGYMSETLPGVTRGPHEHVEQADLFVFIGPGDFRIKLWDNRPSSPTYQNRMTVIGGSETPMRLIVPPGVVHGYTNISKTPAMSYNFPNRLYRGLGRKEPIDEVRHEADPNSPYRM